MRAALGAINLIQVFQREIELVRECLDTRAQFSFGKRGQLVEEWLNERWVD